MLPTEKVKIQYIIWGKCQEEKKCSQEIENRDEMECQSQALFLMADVRCKPLVVVGTGCAEVTRPRAQPNETSYQKSAAEPRGRVHHLGAQHFYSEKPTLSGKT
jgi:hypothetical protein